MTRDRNRRGAFANPVRGRRDQRKPADAVRVVERERQGDGSAQRMTDDERLSQFHDAYRARQNRRLVADPARRGARIARPGPIEGDDVKIDQALDERMGEMADLSDEPVNENDRRAPATVEHMQQLAAEIEKSALGRRDALDPARGERGQPGHRTAERGQNQRRCDKKGHARKRSSSPDAGGHDRLPLRPNVRTTLRGVAFGGLTRRNRRRAAPRQPWAGENMSPCDARPARPLR